jgi:hypothetical protein
MKGTLSEAEFTRMALDLARLHGWRRVHFRQGMPFRSRQKTPEGSREKEEQP